MRDNNDPSSKSISANPTLILQAFQLIHLDANFHLHHQFLLFSCSCPSHNFTHMYIWCELQFSLYKLTKRVLNNWCDVRPYDDGPLWNLPSWEDGKRKHNIGILFQSRVQLLSTLLDGKLKNNNKTKKREGQLKKKIDRCHSLKKHD